VEAVIGDISM